MSGSSGVGGTGDQISYDSSIWQAEDASQINVQDLYDADSIAAIDENFVKKKLQTLLSNTPTLYPPNQERLSNDSAKEKLPEDTGIPSLTDFFKELTTEEKEQIMQGGDLRKLEENGILPEGFSEELGNATQKEYNAELLQALQNDPELAKLATKMGISKEAMLNRVTYEYMTQNPDMPKEIKQFLSKLDGEIRPKVAASIGEGFGIDATGVKGALTHFTPTPDTGSFQAVVQNNFEERVKEYIQENAGSKEEATAALNAYYGIENAQVTSKARTLATQAAASAKGSMESLGVIGESFENVPGKNLYLAVIDAEFSYRLTGIAKDPANPTSAEINLAAAQTQKLYQLKSEWAPSQEAISSTANLSPTMKAGFETVRQLEEFSSEFQSVIDRMPDGPEKKAYVNFLKTVVEALDGLKALLFQMQIKDAGMSQKLSIMERDMNIAKIDKEEKMRAEIKAAKEKQDKKAKDMKIINSVVGVLASVAMLAMALVTGPVAFAVAVVIMASTIHGIADSSAEGGFVNQALNSIPDEGGATLKFVMTACLCAGVAAAGAGPLLGAQLLFTNSTAMQDMLTKDMGTSPMVANIITMATMILVSIATFYTSGKSVAAAGEKASKGVGGASKAAADAAKKSGEVYKQLGWVARAKSNLAGGLSWKDTYGASLRMMNQNNNALTRSIESISKTMTNVEKLRLYSKFASGYYATLGGLRSAEAYLRMEFHSEQASIRLREGDVDAFVQEMQAMIKILKKVLQKLLSGLDSPAEFAKEVQAVLNKVFSAAEQQLNQITQA